MNPDWRLVTHTPTRIVRWAPSDAPWINVQIIHVTDDTEAKVKFVGFTRDELQKLTDQIDASGNLRVEET